MRQTDCKPALRDWANAAAHVALVRQMGLETAMIRVRSRAHDIAALAPPQVPAPEAPGGGPTRARHAGCRSRPDHDRQRRPRDGRVAAPRHPLLRSGERAHTEQERVDPEPEGDEYHKAHD